LQADMLSWINNKIIHSKFNLVNQLSLHNTVPTVPSSHFVTAKRYIC
jgi:hypothetical protein